MRTYLISGVPHAKCEHCNTLFPYKRHSTCEECTNNHTKKKIVIDRENKVSFIIDELTKGIKMTPTIKEKLYSIYPLEELYSIIKATEVESLYYLLPQSMLSIRNSRPSIPTFIKDAVLERDNHCCAKCGSTEHLNLHHVIPYSKCKSHEYDNLLTLCLSCHANEHQDLKGIYQLFMNQIETIQSKLL